MSARSEKRPRPAAHDARAELLRALPPLDECIRAAEQRETLKGFGKHYLKLVVQRAEAELRTAILGGAHGRPDRAAMLDAITVAAERIAAADQPALRPLVNATGVVLHTNLGRALLAERAIEAIDEAARSPVNLEYDLATGTRGERDALVEDELIALTGAEAATVVNNNAAAVLLALNALAEGREVIVSRGELIEIGGSFRLPDVMAKSGARMKEVGTTNRTHPRDYENAISADTALLMKVHPSNYRVSGFTAAVSLEELVAIGTARGIDVLEDLGSGALVDLAAFGLPREPLVAERIAAGASLVTFSGDKLLGGPQAGVIVGRRELIDRIRRSPLKRALRCDKLTLAALEATLRIYLRSDDVAGEIPTLRLMRRTAAELRTVAAQAREILLERLGAEFAIEIVESASEAGSGSMPDQEIKSAALAIAHPRLGPDAIAAMFRHARIIGRIADNRFLLDLRTVEDPAAFAVQFNAP
jgi:L-seryl-tRNA(Ser) seleniumtransferase